MEEYIFTDLEEQIITRLEEGKDSEDIAKEFNVSKVIVDEIYEKNEEYEEAKRRESEKENEGIDLPDEYEAHGVIKIGDDYYKDGAYLDPEEVQQYIGKTNISDTISFRQPRKNLPIYLSKNAEIFKGWLSKLDPREQIVLSLKSGYFDGQPKKDEEIAEKLLISKEEVNKIFKETEVRIKS